MAGTDLIHRATLDELLGWRDRSLELAMEARDAYLAMQAKLKEARGVAARAAPERMPFYKLDEFIASNHDKPEKLAAAIRADLDRAMWNSLLALTGVGGLMDKQARNEFEQQLASDPPEVTFDNVRATFRQFRSDAHTIFRRGLVNVFKNLCREYRSHDGFKIGNRIILTYVMTDSGYFHGNAELEDADRIMHVLDGKTIGEGWYSPLCGALRNAATGSWSTGIRAGSLDTEYWHIKWFKNRNAHLYPKRLDLLRRANRLIAEHFGETLGAGADAAGAKRYHHAKPHQHEVEDFYPTSPALAEEMLALADLQPGMEVLEPSAGDGALVAAILAAGVTPDCVEIDPDRVDALRDMLPPGCVTHMDFLAMHPEPEFDRVLMNPPWGRHADVQHVFHALRFLKPGGRLVAIMSPNLPFRNDGPTLELRGLINAWGGWVQALPPGVFKHAGTMTGAVMVAVNKPAGAALAPPAPAAERPAEALLI